LLFTAERWIPNIESGRWAPFGMPPTRHFTLIFNTFVLMTLFNEINARKIHGERNIFAGLHRNPIFCVIWLGTMAAQILIVTFGGPWFQTARLDLTQWLYCIAFGVGALLWGQILTSIPSRMLPDSCTCGGGETMDAGEMKKDGEPVGEQVDGKVLWMLGLTRVQTQMRVVRAFQVPIQHDRNDPFHSGTISSRLPPSYRERIRKMREQELRAPSFIPLEETRLISDSEQH